MKLNLIYSESIDNIIGVNNDLFCKLPSDLEMFQKITSTKMNGCENVIIMGFNTWTSLKRPLKGRINVVITQNNKDKVNGVNGVNGVMVFDSLNSCFDTFKTIDYGRVFVIGGPTLFSSVMTDHYDMIDIIYQTRINHNVDIGKIHNSTDVVYNDIVINEQDFSLVKSETKTNVGLLYDMKDRYISKEINYTENVHQKNALINHQEYQYLNTLKGILKNKINCSRNGNVYSEFGIRMVFDLREGFPLLTTKRIPWKTVLRELIWFMNGSTDNKLLQDQNVHIWDGNGSKEFLESRGLSYEEGDLGPIYGFQWRHFGAEYKDSQTDYTDQGVDQLKWIINEIKVNPSSRRLIMNAWNPMDIHKMALPPCHVMVQFNIEDGFIDAQLYQRSGDMFLGVPFNISSYSFLLHIIGSITGYIPRKFIHIIGDAHIYEDHVSAVQEQLLRIPYLFPKLEIGGDINIDTINETNFNIHDYEYYTGIKAQMNV